jgi:tetratricopeptide (TPR) repeat protein
MQLELRNPAQKIAAVAVLGSVIVTYVTLAALQYWSAHLSNVPDETHLLRATWLDPGNAEYRYRLGRYELLTQLSPQAALPWLRSAVSLNPNRARYWLDLSLASHVMGDTNAAKDALDHGVIAGPHTLNIAWQAANLYLSQGEVEKAMQELRAVMEHDPYLGSEAVQACWKVRPDIDYLLSDVVPPNVDEPFLEFLIARNEADAAAKVWARAVALQHAIDHRYLFEYIRYLIAHHDVSQAALVWQQAANLSGLAAYQSSSENLLVNSDFSMDILNGGFDWIHKKINGVTLNLDPNEAYSGRSLRITFDGPGIEDAGIRQLVPVEPNTKYEFTAFYKAQEMDGAGGPKFAIQDLYRETPLLMTEELHDTDSWKQEGGVFVTGQETDLIVVRIARLPAGSPIRGKLWIDGLKLTRFEGKETN